ncbi:glycine oxidase maturase GoxB [Marinomonas balearica]|uniref:Flavin-dependent dehydrogenase n=1 Tax=Marinomonas balearica TaxID=491947 RepID=A0A4R6MED0_9GAMM|nr:glycine oxidase maturase GoxB [Marinomonas balearica]TDO99786.1 flavin-dependent dehydrogenase [Marinomonas balearica]
MAPFVYDVAVVGGGLSGAAATIALKQAGYSVVWIRPKFEVTDYKVGESLAPAANPILAELNLSHLLQSHKHRQSNATFTAWGQTELVERNSAIHLEGAGHIINRVTLETDLNMKATNVADRVVEARLSDVSERNGVWLLLTNNVDDPHRVSARFIIDATGRSQILSKKLAHLNITKTKTNDHLVAAYAFLKQRVDSNVIPTQATLIESVDSGWWYASLLANGALSVNFYSDPDLMPKGLTDDIATWRNLINQTEHISFWIKDAEFEIDSPPKITSAATRWLTPAAGTAYKAGWMAIGDAAASFDPLSAHGMTTAFWAAAQCPKIVESYLANDYSALQKYADAVKKGRKNYLLQRNAMYSYEKRFRNNIFWKRRF